MTNLRGRLFWKILFGFWLIFLLMTQLLWVVFSQYGPEHEPPEDSIARRIANLQVDSASSVVTTFGLPALASLQAAWPANERRYLSITPLAAQDKSTPVINPLGTDEVIRQISALDGQRYMLRYDIDGLRNSYHQGRRSNILHMPAPLFWMGLVGGLLFSMLLAWNLTRPMLQMRRAFERVSRGDLSVRLFPMMRRRHDEIADVAKDFDAMAERLQVLVSDREALLHDVSHELRSPLARLQLAIGLANQNPKNVSASLDRIEHETGRLDRMIGELLALSRAEHQGSPGEDYFDLHGLVEAVVNDARYEAQVPGVEIQLNSHPQDDYTVKGNAEMMRRGVENIVRNALRFSTQGQRVHVTLSRVDNLLDITVADQGPGVEEKKLSSIFDPFVRVNGPLNGKGYGLGLAITRKVALAHGGQVAAHNGIHGGLVISIRIPHWSK
ncbi:ATP-binding protein [Acerihabitans sp. TG2]|uniref:ATP-binding protein n=1 Tax=Acerihabitans sp. TG2 TaxID=3096008 RepID=UPI002B230F64|nr:ATP-binding protein [Acerihabitans sp. TG2]MEA9389043.1 ATP-binding protein [Acerihabitans sp. TG2]